MLTRISVIALLLATACMPKPVENFPRSENITVETENSPTEVTVIPSPVIEDDSQKRLTQLAMDDLATRLALNVELIRVISTEAVVWPDAALGCPLTDKVYSPGKVHGYRIRLEAGGQDYDYHTDRTGQIILCEDVKPAEPGLR